MKLKHLYQCNSHVLSANVARIPDKCHINDGWEQIMYNSKALEFKIRSRDHDLKKKKKILIKL